VNYDALKYAPLEELNQISYGNNLKRKDQEKYNEDKG